MQANLAPMVWMFSGQGTQYYHMGKILFDSNQTFRHTILQGEKIIQQYCGFSLLEHLYDDSIESEELLNNAEISHPCIVLVEVAVARMLFAEGFRPHFVLGVNIGEISTAILSNTIPFISGLLLAAEQAKTNHFITKNKNISDLLNNNEAQGEYETENKSLERKSNISTLIKDLVELYNIIKSQNITCHILPISHEKDISFPKSGENILVFEGGNTQQDQIIEKISQITPNYKNVSSNEFWKMLKSPVNFIKAIRFFEKMGPWTYIDCGPTEILSNYAKHNLQVDSKSQFFPILSPNGNVISNFEKIKKHIEK